MNGKLNEINTIKWGIEPKEHIIQQIENQLHQNKKVWVVLDKRYPTSMNSDGFFSEMLGLSKQIRTVHQLTHDYDFKVLFHTI